MFSVVYSLDSYYIRLMHIIIRADGKNYRNERTA